MTQRLDALRRALESGGYDAFFSFAPPTNQYFTGFNGTTSGLIVTAKEALFLCDFRYTEQAGEQVGPAYEVCEVKGSLVQRLGERLEAIGVKRAAFEASRVTWAELEDVKKKYTGDVVGAGDLVAALRRVKDDVETERIRAASELAEAAFGAVLEAVEPGVKERELAALLEYEFKRRGASGTSFDTICLFGARSSLPHGQPGNRALNVGDIVLMDFGCRRDGYCSDLTRTYAYGTIPGPWFEEIYELTLTAQKLAIEAVRPGMTGRELDAVARDLITEAGHGPQFGHGLGHGVGIEIHEEPRLNPHAETVLEPGMVVTIEPGIYLPGQGGVRIEDLVLVTPEGGRVLSSTPKELRILGA